MRTGYYTLTLLTVIAAGNVAAAVVDKSEQFTLAAINQDATHCRLGSAPDHIWPIFESEPSHFDSGKEAWHIIKTYSAGPANPPFTIHIKDRFRITHRKLNDADEFEFKLIHLRGESGKFSEIATSILEMDDSGLWAKGKANGSPDPAGEYYVFRIPDNYSNESKLCEAEGSDTTKKCRSLHFEYYAGGDGHDQYKPELKIGNVEVIGDDQQCEPFTWQAGDGDGDIGPDD